MFRLKFRWPLLLLIPLLSGFIVWTFLIERDRTGQRSIPQEKKQAPSAPIEIKGFAYQMYRSDKLSAKIDAELFQVHSRKFGIFSVRPIREATFIRPRVEIFLFEGDPLSEVNLFPFFLEKQDGSESDKGPLSMKDAGIITRVILKDLEFHIHRGEGKRPLRISARDAVLDLRKKDILMRDVSLEEGSSRSISGPVAVWISKEKRLHFPGAYILKTDAGETRGKDISFDLGF